MKPGLITLLAAMAILTGCASTGRPVKRDLTVPPEVREAATRLYDTELRRNDLVFRLATAAADACKDAPLQWRSPFSLLFNPGGIRSDEVRAALFQVYGIDQEALFQPHTEELAAYRGRKVVAVNGAGTARPAEAFQAVMKAVVEQAPMTLRFDSGTEVQTRPVPACPSLVDRDISGDLKEPQNMGIMEMFPKTWLEVTSSPDEQAFILARSIYFTGGEGRQKLTGSLFAGAAVSGVLRALTFNLSALVADPKAVAVRARRKANRTEADLFALRLMQRAGFDPNAALALARRSIVEGRAWPEDCDELRFDEERLRALQAGISG